MRVDGDRMSLPALGRSLHIRPATYVVRLLSGPGDRRLLAGTVKTSDQLVECGAALQGSRLAVGESVYEGEAGVIGEIPTSETIPAQ